MRCVLHSPSYDVSQHDRFNLIGMCTGSTAHVQAITRCPSKSLVVRYADDNHDPLCIQGSQGTLLRRPQLVLELGGRVQECWRQLYCRCLSAQWQCTSHCWMGQAMVAAVHCQHVPHCPCFHLAAQTDRGHVTVKPRQHRQVPLYCRSAPALLDTTCHHLHDHAKTRYATQSTVCKAAAMLALP
jgi:hypothetical protein